MSRVVDFVNLTERISGFDLKQREPQGIIIVGPSITRAPLSIMRMQILLEVLKPWTLAKTVDGPPPNSDLSVGLVHWIFWNLDGLYVDGLIFGRTMGCVSE